MNLAKMRMVVYGLADEEPNALFSTALVDTYINIGYKKVCRLVPELVTTQAQDVFAGVTEIDLVDPLIEGKDCTVERVLMDGRSLSRVEYDNIADHSATGVPSQYYVRGSKVGFSPAPSGVFTISIDYLRNPIDLVADTDMPDLSDVAATAACKYAVYLIKLSDDEFNTADRWKQEFERDLIDISAPVTGIYRAE